LTGFIIGVLYEHADKGRPRHWRIRGCWSTGHHHRQRWPSHCPYSCWRYLALIGFRRWLPDRGVSPMPDRWLSSTCFWVGRLSAGWSRRQWRSPARRIASG